VKTDPRPIRGTNCVSEPFHNWWPVKAVPSLVKEKKRRNQTDHGRNGFDTRSFPRVEQTRHSRAAPIYKRSGGFRQLY